MPKVDYGTGQRPTRDAPASRVALPQANPTVSLSGGGGSTPTISAGTSDISLLQSGFQAFFQGAQNGLAQMAHAEHLERMDEIKRENELESAAGVADAEAGREINPMYADDRDYTRAWNKVRAEADGRESAAQVEKEIADRRSKGDTFNVKEFAMRRFGELAQSGQGRYGINPIYDASFTKTYRDGIDKIVAEEQKNQIKEVIAEGIDTWERSVVARVSDNSLDYAGAQELIAQLNTLNPGQPVQNRARFFSTMLVAAGGSPEKWRQIKTVLETEDAKGRSMANQYPALYMEAQEKQITNENRELSEQGAIMRSNIDQRLVEIRNAHPMDKLTALNDLTVLADATQDRFGGRAKWADYHHKLNREVEQAVQELAVYNASSNTVYKGVPNGLGAKDTKAGADMLIRQQLQGRDLATDPNGVANILVRMGDVPDGVQSDIERRAVSLDPKQRAGMYMILNQVESSPGGENLAQRVAGKGWLAYKEMSEMIQAGWSLEAAAKDTSAPRGEKMTIEKLFPANNGKNSMEQFDEAVNRGLKDADNEAKLTPGDRQILRNAVMNMSQWSTRSPDEIARTAGFNFAKQTIEVAQGSDTTVRVRSFQGKNLFGQEQPAPQFAKDAVEAQQKALDVFQSSERTKHDNSRLVADTNPRGFTGQYHGVSPVNVNGISQEFQPGSTFHLSVGGQKVEYAMPLRSAARRFYMLEELSPKIAVDPTMTPGQQKFYSDLNRGKMSEKARNVGYTMGVIWDNNSWKLVSVYRDPYAPLPAGEPARRTPASSYPDSEFGVSP